MGYEDNSFPSIGITSLLNGGDFNLEVAGPNQLPSQVKEMINEGLSSFGVPGAKNLLEMGSQQANMVAS